MTISQNWVEKPLLKLVCLKLCLVVFSGVESGGKFPKNSKELIPILEKFNISLCSGWYGANLLKRSVKEEMENIRAQLDL